MPDRTSGKTAGFRHAFALSPLLVPLAPGTYRVITDEDIIPGVAITAYRRSGTMLHIPAVGVLEKTEQYISVDPKELEAARVRDVEAT
ncbi:MAG TPA: hypothetical protein DIC56_16355 [Rhizobium sp.]|nr:hypothetical protein [Rhizobium sp.]